MALRTPKERQFLLEFEANDKAYGRSGNTEDQKKRKRNYNCAFNTAWGRIKNDFRKYLNKTQQILQINDLNDIEDSQKLSQIEENTNNIDDPVISNLAESLDNNMNIGLPKLRATRENRKSNEFFKPEPFLTKSKKRKVSKLFEDKAIKKEEINCAVIVEQIKKLRKSHEFSSEERKSLVGVLGLSEVKCNIIL